MNIFRCTDKECRVITVAEDFLFGATCYCDRCFSQTRFLRKTNHAYALNYVRYMYHVRCQANVPWTIKEEAASLLFDSYSCAYYRCYTCKREWRHEACRTDVACSQCGTESLRELPYYTGVGTACAVCTLCETSFTVRGKTINKLVSCTMCNMPVRPLAILTEEEATRWLELVGRTTLVDKPPDRAKYVHLSPVRYQSRPRSPSTVWRGMEEMNQQILALLQESSDVSGPSAVARDMEEANRQIHELLRESSDVSSVVRRFIL